MADERKPVKLAQATFPDLDLDAVAKLLASGWLTNGGQVRAFEEAFAAYQGVEHAVAVSSCTAALHLALLAHDIGSGDEVITTPFTFAATCNAIVHVGATPVLVDVDADILNIDPEKIERAVTPRTRAIMPVHFAGHPVDIDPIRALADRLGLVIIQDAAHATEARHAGRPMGGLGDTACFSFYATKNLPIGEGGMLTTRDAKVAAAARVLRSHGMSADAFARHDGADERWRHWDMPRPGYNYKMTELAALLGQGQLRHVEVWRERRAALVADYETRLADVDGVQVSARRPDVVHAHHLFVVRIERDGVERDVLASAMKARGVEVSINYRPVHDLSWYRDAFGWTPADFPVASRAGATCLSLPLHPELTAADVETVVETLKALLEGR
jgi:dTDP-4-amino-4,6-dideoxygalactose transaminase